MRLLAAIVVAFAVPALAVGAPEPESAKGPPAQYELHTGHFEKNDSGLKGEASYLVLGDRDAFEKVFSSAATTKKQSFVPKNAFEKKMVVAVIKRGNAPTDYKVEKVTSDEGVLYVQYTAKMGRISSATFRSPLVLTADRNKYKSVVFIENGKKVDTVKVEK
jgi:hypothetical protein